MEIEGHIIHPKEEIMFLGVKIQSDLKWTSQISTLSNKIRSAAGRIRCDGRHLTISDRRTLYMGWVQSLVFSNGLVVLSTSSQTELDTLRTSLNAGLRAIVGLPKYGFADLAYIRSKLQIPSLESIIEYTQQLAAWKKLNGITSSIEHEGMMTRSRMSKNLPHPDQRGHCSKMYEAILTKAWNRIPIQIKNVNSLTTAKQQLKSCLL